MKDAMQKIFVLGDVDMRQSGESTSYGVTSALANPQITSSFMDCLFLAEYLQNLYRAKISSSN